MVKPQDIVIQISQVERGRDCMQVTHTPTGITRAEGPPLVRPGEVQRRLCREIEQELRERGLKEYLLPEPPPTKKRGTRFKR